MHKHSFKIMGKSGSRRTIRFECSDCHMAYYITPGKMRRMTVKGRKFHPGYIAGKHQF